MDIVDVRKRLGLAWKMEHDGDFLVADGRVLLVENISNWKDSLNRIMNRTERQRNLFFYGNEPLSVCEEAKYYGEQNNIFVMFDKSLISPSQTPKQDDVAE